MNSSTKHSALSLHWSQWLCPGPRRIFSAEEMARAGGQPWPQAVDRYVLINVIVLLAINWHEMPRGVAVWASAGLLAMTWGALRIAAWLWRAPTRLRLNLATTVAAAALVGVALLLKYVLHIERELILLPFMIGVSFMAVALSAWWFLTIYRVDQIEARLRELADQEAALKLTRRLATAQIQPHFLFNTLASVQHWVDTQDARAGATLASFTRYLRATLPMFERDSLALEEELQIVRSYLEVMQARLGARLSWGVEIEAGLERLPLPPGALLTLVENAIAHGIEPSLRGGRIELRAVRDAGAVRIEVRDNGAGLCGDASDSTGLANTRTRLAQLHGEAAGLSLSALEPGCLARITVPWNPTENVRSA